MTRSTVVGTALFLFLVSPVKGDDKKNYSLPDLQALAQQEAWEEVVNHLEDVPPAQRAGEWTAVARQGILGAFSDPAANDPSPAAERAYQLVSRYPALGKDPELAWAAGKFARLTQNAADAVPHFARAISKANDPRCKDKDVELAVIAGLGLPADNKIVAPSKQLAFDRCWEALKTSVKAGFSKEGSYYQSNTCAELKEKGLLSGLQAQRCKKP